MKDLISRIQKFRLLDDTFMSTVFEKDIELAQLVLDIILEEKNLTVVSVETQKEFKTVTGRSAIFDIYAVDKDKKPYNIEVQRDDRGAIPERARYYASILDTYSLDNGQNYDKIPESYIIFITENDVLGKGLPLYHIERKVVETNELFNDRMHIIFVNGAYTKTDDKLGKLIHDFKCEDPNQMYNNVIANKVNYFKNEKGGLDYMCKIMETYGKEREDERAKENAINMLRDNLPLEKVVKYSGLSLEEVVALKNNL